MAPPGPDSSAGVRPLLLDALYEVLLRVPAKDLCRCRAVCRPWRALLSDPRFAAAHAARHGPLVVAGRDNHRSAAAPIVDVMDLSGRVLKRVVARGSFWAVRKESVTTSHLDGVCVLVGDSKSCLLLNTATGAVSELPQGFAEEHLAPAWQNPSCSHPLAFGKVASTGVYKVLRLLHSYFHRQHQCEVTTINGSSHARWRGKKASPGCVRFNRWSRVTIDGIVHFLLGDLVVDREENAVPLRLASFDLENP
ncbi:hypothetical protein PVAP13_2KG107900 [Panicum virgatum]|uniref:F-box domain-containing protein n=1 Tax=Panicum virgatum TaxID=38727 RepID=A0A8T0WBM9_PANVG|nr:hypothetical protein PVAP13_2KG107900 [Panicum virgatum]